MGSKRASGVASPVRTIGLALVLVLTGCLASPTAPADEVALAPIQLSLDATECEIVGFAFLVDPSHAQGLLPAGFTPADAQALVGAPAPTGRGMILVESYQCGSHTWADGPIGAVEVSILVAAPDVPGERDPAAFDFYQPLMAANAPALDDLETLHWDHLEVDVVTDVTALPTASSIGTVIVTGDDTTLVTGRGVSPAPSTLQGPARFWQVHAEGTTYLDYAIETTVAAGAAECTIGGAIADAIGITTCTPGEAISLIAPTVAFSAVGRFLPGIQPVAA